jgi:ABC-2 type transport system permease protein
MIWFISDTLVIAGRSYQHLRAKPGELAMYLVFPVIMVVLFGYVFGSAISLPGSGNYKEFLMPGIYVQTMAFTAVGAATEVAEDMSRGVIDRFRTLSIARAAVLTGRSFAELTLRLLGLAAMVLAGTLIAGWRFHNGVPDALAAFGLLALFGFTMIWVGTLIGLYASSSTMADNATFSWLFPLTFLAGTFVPTQGLPGWLRPVADWNPMTAMVAATRRLFGNPNPVATHASWPLQHPLAMSLASSALLLAVFVPLSVHRYRTATAR